MRTETEDVGVFLETDRLVLRRFTAADVDLLVELDGDPGVMRFITGGRATPREIVQDDILPTFLRYYERFAGFGFWAAVQKSTGEYLGWFHFRPPPERPEDVELGYRLRRMAWGHGYATEGSRALIRKGFTELGVQRVVASTMTVNTASRRVLEKVGLRFVRIFHQQWPDPIDGGEHGDVEYALTRAEWKQANRLRRASAAGGLTAEWAHPRRGATLVGMEYTQLGRSGLSVSRLCLGTMNFGPETTEADSHAIMDRAHEHGINFFDTANIYGWKMGEGISEQIIGRWFASGGGRRERTVLATKLYGSMGDWPNEAKLSALNIRKACEGSLRRLRTDYLDLYQMHHVDLATPWEEIWEAMSVLRQQGKIIYVGSSNFAGWHLVAAQEAARRHRSLGLVSEQSIYNLLTRWVELEVLPAARAYGIGLVPWSPLHGGVLSGVLRKQREGTGSRSTAAQSASALEVHRERIEAYEKLCAELGEDPANVGLAWLLHQDGITAPIIGPRTAAQLDSSLRATQISLDTEVLARLDELFPPPGPNGAKPAPEAYAW
ncbi:MAG: aldo/keto reductase [Pseudonocardiaceae bacterium]